MLQGGRQGGRASNTQRGLFWSTKTTSKIGKILLFHRKNQYLRRKSTIFKKIFQNFVSENFFASVFLEIFFEKFWKTLEKSQIFFLNIDFSMKSRIFQIFEAPSAPRKCFEGGFEAPSKGLYRCLPPSFGRGPPTISLIRI